ncbi:WYL domain-containing protein [Undibacterium amnicola]|uniref:WYL domain-containing protein n=1 Tax=Undibacterium amnicola TaxID=1834038 RepID=A0ABR6XS72_9BURK|nr:WYL domain-containing protein [Undibacterium amnicola]MBC3832350.1 WYL domain-containing protein [Undibacterium amnicola]
MSTDNHDTLVYRLSQMLIKLNQGQKLVPKDLAEEFGVNLRTIQRDLNIRFAYLPLEKKEGGYRLDAHYLGKLSTKDIERFAGLAGVKGLFPSLSDEFLGELFDARIGSNMLVQGHNYEDLTQLKKEFSLLEKAIKERKKIAFCYLKNDTVKSYEEIAPYKLINNKGIWYLAAQDKDKLKTFSFTKIRQLDISSENFVWEEAINQQLLNEDGIWLSTTKQTITMSVSKEIAHYFKRRKLIPLQVIEEERHDGSLVVSSTVAHLNQIFPIIRYWIPHLQIVSPFELQKQLLDELIEYANKL